MKFGLKYSFSTLITKSCKDHVDFLDNYEDCDEGQDVYEDVDEDEDEDADEYDLRAAVEKTLLMEGSV